jgi:FO synthase subunit 2
MAANVCREVAPCGEHVTYVINRNINFTNACVMRCGFCAFSRTGIDEEAYFLPLVEILRRAKEAASLGATEICVQAGLPPNMNPELYPSVARAIKAELPNVHLHAFSPEEVRYGAKRRKSSISEMIQILKDAGVDTLPGTSAEILVDSVRDRIAKGRLSSAEWIEVITAAHAQGISTTATMM